MEGLAACRRHEPSLRTVAVFMAIHEGFEVRSNVDALTVAAIADLITNIFRNVASPTLGGDEHVAAAVIRLNEALH